LEKCKRRIGASQWERRPNNTKKKTATEDRSDGGEKKWRYPDC